MIVHFGRRQDAHWVAPSELQLQACVQEAFLARNVVKDRDVYSGHLLAVCMPRATYSRLRAWPRRVRV